MKDTLIEQQDTALAASEPAVDRVLKRHPGATRQHLIPILQEIQEEEGYLSKEAVIKIGRHLRLPASKVFGVATFYNQFRFHQIGRFHVQVCRGTACHVKGSADVLQAVSRHLSIQPGETARDGMFSLEVVACLGACGLSPVICVNGEFHAGVTPDSVKKILMDYRRKADQGGHSAKANE